MWEQLLFVVLAFVLLWFLIKWVRRNPGAFSLSNINKSLTTLGVLALILIGFIGLLAWWLRQGQ